MSDHIIRKFLCTFLLGMSNLFFSFSFPFWTAFARSMWSLSRTRQSPNPSSANLEPHSIFLGKPSSTQDYPNLTTSDSMSLNHPVDHKKIMFVMNTCKLTDWGDDDGSKNRKPMKNWYLLMDAKRRSTGAGWWSRLIISLMNGPLLTHTQKHLLHCTCHRLIQHS